MENRQRARRISECCRRDYWDDEHDMCHLNHLCSPCWRSSNHSKIRSPRCSSYYCKPWFYVHPSTQLDRLLQSSPCGRLFRRSEEYQLEERVEQTHRPTNRSRRNRETGEPCSSEIRGPTPNSWYERDFNEDTDQTLVAETTFDDDGNGLEEPRAGSSRASDLTPPRTPLRKEREEMDMGILSESRAVRELLSASAKLIEVLKKKVSKNRHADTQHSNISECSFCAIAEVATDLTTNAVSQVAQKSSDEIDGET